MKFFIPLVASSLAALALPALAQDTPAKPADVETAKQPKEEKKICKRVSSGMGSRRTERVCLTADEWREANHQ